MHQLHPKTPPSADGRVPIVLGVTGHRTLGEGDPDLREALRNECRALKKAYPSSPFVLLSALAEGADRIVAGIVMAELDAALLAVLPLPRAEYEKDFDTPASHKEFSALLARAVSVVEAPLPEADDSWSEHSPVRNAQYAWAGAFIAEHSQILLALWDGEPARGLGGTSDVVSWFNRGYAPRRFSAYRDALSPLDPPEPGWLIHLNPNTGQVERRKNKTEEVRESDIVTILARIDQYNVNVLRERAVIDRNNPVIYGAEDLQGEENMRAKRALASAPAAANVYRAADALSVHLAPIVRNADRGMYTLALAAFLAFNFLTDAPFAALAYVGLALAMLALWTWAGKNSLDSRFLEFRALAEAMRVLFFWRVAGIEKSVWLSYLSKHSGVVHWIRHAARTVELLTDAERRRDLAIRMEQDGLAVARTHWLDAQIGYYRKSGQRHDRQSRKWLLVIRGSLIVSSAVAVAFVALTIRYGGEWPVVGLETFLKFLLGFTAALGLSVRAYLIRRADLELRKQYTAALQIFEIARANLDAPSEGEGDWSAEEILERLGREALHEHGEWMWLRHSRPFEVPQ